MADFLTDMRDLITAHSVDISIAEKIIVDISKTFGGETIYVKKKTADKTMDKHDLIRRKFTGSNHRQLCHEFDIGLQQVYKILKPQVNNCNG